MINHSEILAMTHINSNLGHSRVREQIFHNHQIWRI